MRYVFVKLQLCWKQINQVPHSRLIVPVVMQSNSPANLPLFLYSSRIVLFRHTMVWRITVAKHSQKSKNASPKTQHHGNCVHLFERNWMNVQLGLSSVNLARAKMEKEGKIECNPFSLFFSVLRLGESFIHLDKWNWHNNNNCVGCVDELIDYGLSNKTNTIGIYQFWFSGQFGI